MPSGGVHRHPGLCRIYEVPGGGHLGFCSHLDVARKGRAPIITLLSDDVEGWHERLLAAGLRPSEPVTNPKFEIHHFFVSDPDGYLVEIQTFL